MTGYIAFDDEPAGPGHNDPPDDITILRERLADDWRDLAERRDQLAAALARLPDVKDEAAAAKVADFLGMVAAVERETETRHKAAKEPHLKAGRVVDEAKNAMLASLTPIRVGAAAPLEAYAKAKRDQERAALAAAPAPPVTPVRDADLSRIRGESGTVAGLSGQWKCTAWDRATVDLDALRPYLAEDAIQRAANEYARRHKEKSPLRGATIEYVETLARRR